MTCRDILMKYSTDKSIKNKNKHCDREYLEKLVNVCNKSNMIQQLAQHKSQLSSKTDCTYINDILKIILLVTNFQNNHPFAEEIITKLTERNELNLMISILLT